MRPVHFIQSLSETDVVSSGQILASWNWLFLQISNNAKLPAAERDTLLEDFRKCGRHGLRITTLCAGSSTTVFVDRECRQQGCGVHAFWGWNCSSVSFLKVAWTPFASNGLNTHERVSVYSILFTPLAKYVFLLPRGFSSPRTKRYGLRTLLKCKTSSGAI